MAFSPIGLLRKLTKRSVINIVIAAVIIGLSIATFSLYREVQTLKNPQAQSDAEVAALVAKVSQLIVLPTDEKPTVATVTDPEKLKDQPFFANAKNGDKVLIYTTAKKAILYDPNLNRIVEVAPLSLGANAPTTGATTPPATTGTKPTTPATPPATTPTS